MKKGEHQWLSNRRRFLRQTSLGMGAAILSVPMLSFSSGRSMPATGKQPAQTSPGTKNEGKLGIALVGLGQYSSNQLAPALQETKNCYLAGIVTGTPTKADAWKAKYNIPDKNIYNYDTFDQIADNPDIDIVYVVLPNALHAEYTIRAARAKKDVICEKPMATSVEDGQRMLDACRENGVQLAIGYRLHFDPFHQRVMELGQQQVYGKVKSIRAEDSFDITTSRPNRWRLNKEPPVEAL